MSSNADTISRSANILLGVTGSVATIKLEDIIQRLSQSKQVANICVVATQNARKFLAEHDGSKQNLLDRLNAQNQMPDLNKRLKYLLESKEKKSSTNTCHVFSFDDADEWSSWSKRNDPVLHIELRKWADLLLVAPLDANTLAKISNGICDNLLTCVIRAWDLSAIKTKPIFICPAMNTFMYMHPLTSRQLSVLIDQFGFSMIECVEKTLMCGDSGLGAMASVDSICNRVLEFLASIENKE
jgi:phosphopantothenoylcysteine decarboxylase